MWVLCGFGGVGGALINWLYEIRALGLRLPPAALHWLSFGLALALPCLASHWPSPVWLLHWLSLGFAFSDGPSLLAFPLRLFFFTVAIRNTGRTALTFRSPTRIIKPNKNRDETDEIASVVAETTKYPLKSIDLYKIDWKVFKELTGQVKNLRFISYGGIVKQYRTALFGTDEFDDKDLVTGYDELDLSVWEKIGRLWYGLDAGKYKLYSFEQGEKNDK
jgi:hypothetical protein